MAKFDDYTQKNTPEDNDITLILDKTANVNKKTPFSGIWTWIVNKMTNAVIQNLQTSNKTMIGAINELNSKTTKTYKKQTSASYPVLKIIPSYSNGNMICFVNRSSCIDIYVYNDNSSGNMIISTNYVYGTNYEVVSDGSAIYIKVNGSTANFVSSLYDCSVDTAQSLPS